MNNNNYKFIKSRINDFDLNNKKVFLRADLNVPIESGKIIAGIDDFRLKSILPTLDLLLKKNAKIILATHIGNPKDYDQSLSTKILIPWFVSHNYKIEFCSSLEDLNNLENIENNKIILLENLRFWSEEKSQDFDFAKKLKNGCEFYINDAFGTLHRDDTSIAILPRLFDVNHKTIGLLVQKELENLNKLKYDAQSPFILIMGGAKIKDKLPLIENFINKVDKILLCPAIVFTFLKAKSINVGKSLVDDSVMQITKNIIDQTDKLLFPKDYLVAQNSDMTNLKYVLCDKIGDNDFGISVGPETLEYYKKEIANAKTIFFNGSMGFSDNPQTEVELRNLLQLISQSKAFTLVGGGESVAAISKLNLFDKISFCSSGGGSVLAYLADQNLPGLTNLLL